MPYHATHPCKDTYVHLEVMRESLDVGTITRLLELPTAITGWQTGYPDDDRVALPRVQLWKYSTWGAADPQDFDAHVTILLHQLRGKVPMLQRLRKEQHRLYINCVWIAQGDLNGRGPSFTAPQLRELAQLELPIRFTLFLEEPDTNDDKVV